MRKVRTPDKQYVDVADIVIRYKDTREERQVSVVVDDDLALEIGVYISDPDLRDPDLYDNDWLSWDLDYFYYLTQHEWSELQNGGSLPGEDWEVVVSENEVTA